MHIGAAGIAGCGEEGERCGLTLPLHHHTFIMAPHSKQEYPLLPLHSLTSRSTSVSPPPPYRNPPSAAAPNLPSAVAPNSPVNVPPGNTPADLARSAETAGEPVFPYASALANSQRRAPAWVESVVYWVVMPAQLAMGGISFLIKWIDSLRRVKTVSILVIVLVLYFYGATFAGYIQQAITTITYVMVLLSISSWTKDCIDLALL